MKYSDAVLFQQSVPDCGSARENAQRVLQSAQI